MKKIKIFFLLLMLILFVSVPVNAEGEVVEIEGVAVEQPSDNSEVNGIDTKENNEDASPQLSPLIEETIDESSLEENDINFDEEPHGVEQTPEEELNSFSEESADISNLDSEIPIGDGIVDQNIEEIPQENLENPEGETNENEIIQKEDLIEETSDSIANSEEVNGEISETDSTTEIVDESEETNPSEEELLNSEDGDLIGSEHTENSEKVEDVIEGTVEEVIEMMAMQEPTEVPRNEVTVSTFEELENAINNATTPIKIIISGVIDFSKTITINNGKDILLTATGEKINPIESKAIELPQEDDSVLEKQNLVNEAEEKADEALTSIEENPIVSENGDLLVTRETIISRAENFLGTFFRVINGKLVIGEDKTDPILFDGKNIRTEISDGAFIDIGSKGEVTLNGGTITRFKNNPGYSAPIKVNDGGTLVMNGGRITGNDFRGSPTYPNSAGGVYVNKGGTFVMNNGSIDSNKGHNGGVNLGDIFKGSGKFAEFTMNGGIIANNHNDYSTGTGGGVSVNAASIFNFNDGIIAGNSALRGGGISVIDHYVTGFDGVSYSKTYSEPYEDYVENGKSELNMNGGVIYSNHAFVEGNPNLSGAGGGVYVSSSFANFNEGYILDNKADNMGGGIYVSIVPYTQTLENILITENEANSTGSIYHHSGGNGGGIWNCPIGDVIFEDYNSVYSFDNTSTNQGKDLYLMYKNEDYKLNGIVIGDKKYSTVSPITKDGNIIEYVDSEGNVTQRWTNTDDTLELTAIYNEMLINEAWKNSKIFVIGNEAQKGGGIGSNANIYAPGNPQENLLKIIKKWDPTLEDKEIPESIQVDIYIGDLKYRDVTLNRDNNWSAEITDMPFSNEELIEKGITYSVKEVGNDFYVVYESEYNHSKTEELGVLNIQRIISKIDEDKNIKIYENPDLVEHEVSIIYKDLDKETFLGTVSLDKSNNWTSKIESEVLLNLVNEAITITKHGQDVEYLWGYKGLDNYQVNHYIIISKNDNGEVVIDLPYIWLERYSNNPNRYGGFTAEFGENIKKEIPEEFSFTITNYKPFELPVEKIWDPSIKTEDIPESIRVYLLKDGKHLLDANNEKIFLDLDESNNWKGVFKNLAPISIGGLNYSVKEDSDKFTPTSNIVEYTKVYFEILREYSIINFYEYTHFDDLYGGDNNVKSIPFVLTVIDTEESIPFELLVNGKDKYYSHIYYPNDHWAFRPYNAGFTIGLDTKNPKIVSSHYYYDDENKIPFPANYGERWNTELSADVPGVYELMLKKQEDGTYMLYIPRLQNFVEEETLLKFVEDSLKYTSEYKLVVTNKYPPEDKTKYGDLIVTKTVIGGTDEEVFEFRLTLTDKNDVTLEEAYDYLITKLSEIIEEGKIASGEIFNLRNGESIRIKQIPYTTKYVIEELTTEGYRVVAENSIGEIGAQETFVNFINIKENPPEEPEEPYEPEEPPVIYPDTPEVPEEIIETPEIPLIPLTPAIPKEAPKAPEVPRAPLRPGEAPRTFDCGIGIYGFILGISLMAIVFLERKMKKTQR